MIPPTSLTLQNNTPPTGIPVSVYVIILMVALGAVGFVLYRRWQSRRALVRRLGELSVLADVSRSILDVQLDLNRLAELVYQQAGQIVDTGIFQLGLFEDDRYRFLIWIVDGEPRPPMEFRLTPDTMGIVGWMREHHRSLLVKDFEAELASLPARPRYISNNPPRSAVFVPLLAGDEVLGVIAIQSRRPNAFSEEDLRLLTIIANLAAAALEKGRLYEQAQRRAAQLARLSEISQQLDVLQPLPALYRQVVELATDKFGPYSVSYFEMLSNGQLTLRATTRAEWLALTMPLTFPLGEGHVGEAAQARRAVVVQELPDYAQAAEAGFPPATAELAVPLEINDRVLGVLEVLNRKGTFDEIAITIFRSLAAQLAVGILEGQTYAAEQHRAEQLATLAQVSRTVTSQLELEDLFDEVLDLLEERFGYKRAHIFLAHPDRLVFGAGLGRGAERWSSGEYHLPLDGPGLMTLAARTRQTVRVNNVAAHADYLSGYGLDDTQSEMAAPMVMAGHLLGVFDVQSELPNAFSADDEQILQTLADTLAVAIRNARLFEAERRRRRLAEILREVSAALTATLHLDDVLDLILNGLDRVVSYDVASILLVNEPGEITLRAIRGLSDTQGLIGLQLEVRLFEPGEAFPATVPFEDVDHQSEYHELLSLPDPHTCLGAVLALPNEHLGYLVVDRASVDGFVSEEKELIAAFASQAAVAIQNARLYTAQREQAWMSTALVQVAEATARSTELNDVLETVAKLTPMLVGVDRCAVLLAESESFAVRAYDSLDTANPMSLPERILPDQWPGLAEMLATQAPVVLDPDQPMPIELRPLFVGVVILLPLLARGHVAGALVVGQIPGEVPFTTDRIRLISGIANQTALAIESALLYQAQQEEAWVSTALLQVAEALAGQPLETGLETVTRLTPLLVGIERLIIFQYESGNESFRLGRVLGMEHLTAEELAEIAALAAHLKIDRDETRPLIEFEMPGPLARAFRAERGMAWPLRAGGDLLGALVVEQLPGLGRRLNILNGIAHQLAMAMENARLLQNLAHQQRLEHEMEVGRDIQASFLPETCPQAPGWEIVALWQAARQVGGDFYDFIPLRPHEGSERWGIVIADVADKGVPAALFMALSRTLIRSIAINRISPAATLTRVNELILSDARSEQFVTVFYGVWEPATGHFVYASAGHNPPLLVSAEGEVTKLLARGTALGVLEEVEYQEHETHLRPGEALFMYTDGVTDAVNSEMEEFTLTRAMNVLRDTHTESASGILRALSLAIETHVGATEAFDDITMLVVKHLE